MIAFNIVNLLPPGDPDEFNLQGKNVSWSFVKSHNYRELKTKIIETGQCANTYSISSQADRNEAGDALTELRHICLAASFLMGSAITISGATSFSDIAFIQVGDGFPRDRALSNQAPIYGEESEFVANLERMVSKFDEQERENHLDIIIHHWLDSLSCWSLEDLHLSACTVMEIVKQNERRRISNPQMYLVNSIDSIGRYLGLTHISRDWYDMRIDLVHEGFLSKNKYPNHTKQECADTCCDLLNWIDEYIYTLFNLTKPKATRHQMGSLYGLNSYTIW